MATLTGKAPGTTYKDLLTVYDGDDNEGLESSLKYIFDGDGVQSALQLSTKDLDIATHDTSSFGLKLAGTLITASAAEINVLDDVAAGTVSVNSAVVVDANKDISGFRNLTASGTITAANFTGTGDTTIGDAATDTLAINATITTDLIFEGSTANDFETTLTPGDPTADRTVTLPDATDTLVGRATTDTLTNKTLTSPTITGTGAIAGTFTGNVTGNLTGNVTGNSTGNVTGNVTGDLTGDVTGDLTGDVTGDLTGDVTGDVTGALTGNADTVTTNANLTGDVTSVGNATVIAAGVIVDADVKSDAAIAYSKLGSIPTWNQNTSGRAATVTTNANLTGDVTSVGNATVIAAGVIVDADVKSDAAIAYSKLGSVPTWNQSTSGTAALATKVTVSDNNDNENFPVVFHDETNDTNALLDDTGALRYNPSTGELLVPKLTVAGTTTTVDTVTMEAANAIIFEGATADANETTLSIVDPTADKTIYLPNLSGWVPLLAAVSTTAITSTPEELNILDGVTSTATEINLLDGLTTLSGSNTGDQILPTDFVSKASGGTFGGDLTIDGDVNIGVTGPSSTYMGDSSADDNAKIRVLGDTILKSSGTVPLILMGSGTSADVNLQFYQQDNLRAWIKHIDSTHDQEFAVNAGDLIFKTHASGSTPTEKFRISGAGVATFAGDIYQGTSSPILHSAVRGIVFENGSLLNDVTRSAGKSITLAQNVAIDAGNTWAYLSTDEASYYQQFNGNHYFSTAPSGTSGADATLTAKLTILNSGNATFAGDVGIGVTNPAAALHVSPDNNNNDGDIKVGTRAWFSHRDSSTTKTWIANDYNDDSATFGIRMKGVADSNEVLTITGSGNSTFSGTLGVTGHITATTGTFSGNLDTADNARIRLGNGSDLQIYHDGSHSYITDSGTGNLYLNTNSFRVTNAGANEQVISAYENGAVELYYDDVKKIETTSAGATITGTLGSGAITSTAGISGTTGTFSGDVTVEDTSAQIKLMESGDNAYYVALSSYHNAGDTFALYGYKGDYLKHIRTDDADEDTHTLRIGGAMKRVDIWSNGSQRLLIDETGKVGIGTASPSAKIHVDEVANASYYAKFGSTETANAFEFYNGASGDNGYFGGVDQSSGGNNFVIHTDASFDSYFAAKGGKVGIGTASPLYNLHIHNGTDGNLALVAEAGESRVLSMNDADNAYKPLKFYGSRHEFLVGNVGIGTDNPLTELDVNGRFRSIIAGTDPSSGTGLEMYYDTSSTEGRIYAYDRSGSAWKDLKFGNAALIISANTNATFAGKITANDDIWSYDTASASSARLEATDGTGTINVGKNGSVGTSFLVKTQNSAGSPVTALTINSSQNATFAGNVYMLGNYLGLANGGQISCGDSGSGHIKIFAGGTNYGGYIDLRAGGNSGDIRMYTGTSGTGTVALTLDSSQNATFAGRVHIDTNNTFFTGRNHYNNDVVNLIGWSSASWCTIGHSGYGIKSATGNFKIDGGDDLFAVAGTFTGNVEVSTASQPHLQIQQTSGNAWRWYTAGTDSFIRNATGGHNILSLEADGDVGFYNSDGSATPFFWDASTERLGIGVTDPDAPLEISHATLSKINITKTGVNAGQFAVYNDGNAHINAPGIIYLNNTSGSGIHITGASTFAGDVVRGTGSVAWATLPGIRIANGASTYSFYSASDGTKTWFGGIDHNMSGGKMGMGSNHPLMLVTNNVEAMSIDTSQNATFAGNVTPSADNSKDLGSSSYRWANLYVGDMHLKNDRGDWTVIEEEEYLSLKNNKNGKTYKLVMEEV